MGRKSPGYTWKEMSQTQYVVRTSRNLLFTDFLCPHIFWTIIIIFRCSSDSILQFASHTVWFFAKSIVKKIAKEWTIWQTDKIVSLTHKLCCMPGWPFFGIFYSILLANLINQTVWLANVQWKIIEYRSECVRANEVYISKDIRRSHCILCLWLFIHGYPCKPTENMMQQCLKTYRIQVTAEWQSNLSIL